MRVSVCGHCKVSRLTRPPRLVFAPKEETVMLRLEVDYELTADEARRPGEMVHVEIWDVFIVEEFQVRSYIANPLNIL